MCVNLSKWIVNRGENAVISGEMSKEYQEHDALAGMGGSDQNPKTTENTTYEGNVASRTSENNDMKQT